MGCIDHKCIPGSWHNGITFFQTLHPVTKRLPDGGFRQEIRTCPWPVDNIDMFCKYSCPRFPLIRNSVWAFSRIWWYFFYKLSDVVLFVESQCMGGNQWMTRLKMKEYGRFSTSALFGRICSWISILFWVRRRATVVFFVRCNFPVICTTDQFIERLILECLISELIIYNLRNYQ